RKTAYERLLVARRRHLEAGRRAVPRELPLPDASSMALAQQIMARGPSPLQELDQKEMARRVRQAVAQLSEPDQEILFMRSFEGLSYQEVGYLLEVDPATARKRHGRALLRLTQFLADHGLTESQL